MKALEDAGAKRTMCDIADMMIEGLLDSETGELIDGDAPGYPRSRTTCPQCGKRLKTEQGVQQHVRDVHDRALIERK